jgi:hypothetical protein
MQDTEKNTRAILYVKPAPENCTQCPLHILTLENKSEIFSCAGHRGRGTLNPQCDFLNTFDSYSKIVAPNCPLKLMRKI